MSISNYTRAAAAIVGEVIAVRLCVRGTARYARDIDRHLGPRDIQPMLCSVAVRSAALSPFPRPFNPGIGRRWQCAGLGVHGAGGQRLCAGPLWISDLQAASGCSASLERAQAVPFRFACLRPAAGCCSLFIDSSQRAWGSRHQSAPEQPRLDPR